jgi:hypothetical protein
LRAPASSIVQGHGATSVRSPPEPPPVATLRPLSSPMTGLPRLPEPPFRRAAPTTPADQTGARVDCFPARAAFPKWQEGRHPHCHFRGLLRLHMLRPAGSLSRPEAIFVTRLRPFRSPGRAARQLPDQSTSLRVESSSTGDPRLRGALPIPDMTPCSARAAPLPSHCKVSSARRSTGARVGWTVARLHPITTDARTSSIGSHRVR